MRELVVLAARDLRAHLPLIGVAVAASSLAWVTPWLPGLARHGADLREATALVVAALVGCGFSLAVGAGLLSRDLAEGRIGFFLALPVRPVALWVARLLAGSLVVYGAIALVLLPFGAALGRGVQEDALRMGLAVPGPLGMAVRWLPTGLGVLVPLALVLLAHQLAVALRARTAWMVFELFAFAAAGLVVADGVERLFAASAWPELWRAVAGVVVATLLALVIAGAAGLARGRGSLARVHRAQALCAGAGVLAAALGANLFSRWVVTPSLADVVAVHSAIAAPAGPWVVVQVGVQSRPGFHPWALFDRERGSWLRLGAEPRAGSVALPRWVAAGNEQAWPLELAADGRSALWRRSTQPMRATRELVWVDLGGPRPTLVETGVTVSVTSPAALSRDGRHLAVRGERTLAVWERDGQRQLVAVAASAPSGPESVHFTADGGVVFARLLGEGRDLVLQLARLDPRARTSTSRSVPVAPGVDWSRAAPGLVVSPAGDRLLVHDWNRRLSLHAVDDGRQLAEAAGSGSFLADGRLLAWSNADAGGAFRLEMLDGMGGSLGVATAKLGPGWLDPLGEVRPGVLLVAWFGPPAWELYEVEVATGAWRPVKQASTAPVLGPRGAPLPTASSARPWLLLLPDDERQRLVAYEPATGRAVPLLPKPPG